MSLLLYRSALRMAFLKRVLRSQSIPETKSSSETKDENEDGVQDPLKKEVKEKPVTVITSKTKDYNPDSVKYERATFAMS